MDPTFAIHHFVGILHAFQDVAHCVVKLALESIPRKIHCFKELFNRALINVCCKDSVEVSFNAGEV